jgi:light-regulated signal transduction histidine kinase (bacteriophytochrome)
VRQVRWGGNPSLAKLQNIPGARLSPRQSFDTWQETVRGRSQPWSQQHLDAARDLRDLIERMERQQHRPAG